MTAINLTSTTGSGFLETDFDQIKDLVQDGGVVLAALSDVQVEIESKAPTDAPTFTTSITTDFLTASEIVISDANKKFVSAPVATYPSLTELSYVKGLSSAVQSQLNAKIANVVDDTTPQLGGNLDWNSNGMTLVGQTVGGSDGNLVYLSSANTWTAADADTAASCSGMLGIRVSSTVVLTHGLYTTTGLTAGSIYYASTTAGGITTTAPSAIGDIVRIIGYALSITELFFNPDGTYIEVV